MALRSYPAGLPGPSGYGFGPQERARRPPAELGGLAVGRAFAREPLLEAEIRWRLNAAQTQAWRDWWAAELASGMRWFLMPLPGRGGRLPRAVRFVGPPQYTHLGNGVYDVAVPAQVRASGVMTATPWQYEGAVVSIMETRQDAYLTSEFNRDGNGDVSAYVNAQPDLWYHFAYSVTGQYVSMGDDVVDVAPFGTAGRVHIEGNISSAAGHTIGVRVDFIDSDEELVAYWVMDREANFKLRLKYWTPAGGLQTAAASGSSWPVVHHILTFGASQITATSQLVANHVNSHAATCNAAGIVRMRVSGGFVDTRTPGIGIGQYCYLRIRYYPTA